MILVIGSTGTVGSEVVRRLRAADAPVRALVRSTEKGADAAGAGAELAIGDCSDAASLDAALAGVDHLFLVLPGSPDQVALETAAVEAAQRAGGVHVVKLSVVGADPAGPVRFGASHGTMEGVIRESGLGWTFLRPTDFMQNALGWAGSLPTGTVYSATPDAAIASVDVRDIADVAVAALTTPGHDGKTYTLTGPTAPTRREQTAILAAAAGLEATVVAITPEQARDAMLGAGYPEYAVGGILELDEFVYAPGHAAHVEAGVREALGVEARSWETFAADHADAFKG